MAGPHGQFQKHLTEYVNGNLGTAFTIDFGVGLAQFGTLNSASCALAFANPKSASRIVLRIAQDATGGRMIVWPGALVGTPPAPNPAPSAVTLYDLYYNGAVYYFDSSSGGVTTFNARSGAVSPAAADYNSSQVTDASTAGGATVLASLNNVKTQIGAIVSGVSSVFGRAGAIVSVAGDYAASKINNDSATVTGTHVSDALDALKTLIGASVTGVSSVYGRTGAVIAAAGDYAASKVNNDSATVTGAHVSDALDALKASLGSSVSSLTASIAALVTGVSSVYGRTGAIVATAGDYPASKINNDSASVLGAHVSNALDALQTAIGALTSTSIANASGVVGTNVTAALNALGATISALSAATVHSASIWGGIFISDDLNAAFNAISTLDTNHVANASFVPGTGLSNTLNYLQHSSFSGNVQIAQPPCEVVPVGYHLGFSYSPAGWVGIGGEDSSGACVIIPLGPFPTALTLATVSVSLQGAPGSHGALPAHMPAAVVVGVTGYGSITVVASATDTSGSVSAYEGNHGLTMSPNVAVSSFRHFYLQVYAEYGSNSAPGLQIGAVIASLQ